MFLSLKAQPVRIGRRLALIVLSIAIFVWGLQAKLSLYNVTAAASHSSSAAKLIQDKRASNKVVTVEHRAPKSLPTSLASFSTMAFSVLAVLQIDRRYQEVRVPAHYSILQYPSSLIVRPPPYIC